MRAEFDEFWKKHQDDPLKGKAPCLITQWLFLKLVIFKPETGCIISKNIIKIKKKRRGGRRWRAIEEKWILCVCVCACVFHQIHSFLLPFPGRDQILRSICPQIYGLSVVKLALALVVIGGVAHVEASGMKVRGESHLLLVGEPGTGKSQFLRLLCCPPKKLKN